MQETTTTAQRLIDLIDSLDSVARNIRELEVRRKTFSRREIEKLTYEEIRIQRGHDGNAEKVKSSVSDHLLEDCRLDSVVLSLNLPTSKDGRDEQNRGSDERSTKASHCEGADSQSKVNMSNQGEEEAYNMRVKSAWSPSGSATRQPRASV